MRYPRSLRFILFASVASLSLVGCGPSPNSADLSKREQSFSNLDPSVLINLPSSISAPPSQRGLSKASATGGTDATPHNAGDIYDGIRAWVGFADELVNNEKFGVAALIVFWRDALPWGYIQKTGVLSGVEGKYVWTATYDNTREFAYHLTVTTNLQTALQIQFNGESELPAGEVFYNVALLDSTVTNGAKVLVEFQKTSSMRSLDVSITSNGPQNPTDEDFQNGKLVMREMNGIVHLSGSSYHPNMDSILPGVKGHCYTFTGVVDMAANRAMINLGLPPAGYDKNDGALFTTYGVAEVFMSALIIQEIPKLQDTLKMVLATSYKDSMSIEDVLAKMNSTGSADFLRPVSEIQNMSVADFTYFLELNQDITDGKARRDFAALLWIANLKQPVYFGLIGYVGNGPTAPAGFGVLASVGCLVDPLAPNMVKNLVIAQ